MFARILFRYRRLVVLLTLIFILIFLIYKPNVEIPKEESIDETRGPTLDKRPRLALIVPFRDRFDELLTFVPYMTQYLMNQNNGPFYIYIINQSSRFRFNRGSLANVGYMIAKNHTDYIAIHDVDLVPMNTNLSYAYPELGPYHISSPEYHPNYNYDKYFGGILLINNKHFESVNGFSNRYFGWGLEDDEFYARIRAAKIPTFRPSNLTTDRNNTFLHYHHSRKRDTYRTKEQRDILRYRDKVTGLNNLKYVITSRRNLTIDDSSSCVVFNVEIDCDIEQTPWCLPIQAKPKSASSSKVSRRTVT